MPTSLESVSRVNEVWVGQNWGQGQLVFQKVIGLSAFFGPL